YLLHSPTPRRSRRGISEPRSVGARTPCPGRGSHWTRRRGLRPQDIAAQAATLAPRPPFNARVETVTTKPFFREPFTGGAIVRKIAAASRGDHLPCGPLQAARGLQRSGLC